MGPARFHCATLLSVEELRKLLGTTKPSKRFLVRSGIRTHAHRRGLRPERSALDRSAILTCQYQQRKVGLKLLATIHFKELKKGVEDPGIDPGTSRMLSERSTI